MTQPGEQCDDSNTLPADGCDASCQFEPGFDCSQNPQPCTPIIGDGIITPKEECDD